ncbi:MAG: hypothetical protein CMN55_03850 [Sneathiella sp.]|uniref:ankyrin repeat domain-containing protein n=1 Tax=Sneathiella sp. TaxID=1964365 RepID=UPI000C5271AD|nr:ankyrin repeat domain-containing protein [Sneathiella sp.]MAL78234.1 hypothetical protein [Sneathiella sp.]
MRIPGTHGQTLLHIAARRNRAGICRWLLCLGANVNRTDILDRTALHDAVRHNAADVARLLIAHGADLDAKDWQGRTPLDLADAGDSAALAQAIREEISTRHARKVKTVHLTQAGTTTDAG